MTTLCENIFNGAEKSKGQNQATMARYPKVFTNLLYLCRYDENGIPITGPMDKDWNYSVWVTDDGYANLFQLIAIAYGTSMEYASRVF